ncbi:MAG: GNAT family N-acetyltransferase [Acidobacteriota bacterium]
MATVPAFRIRFITEIELLRQCIEVQKRAWGFSDQEVLPLRTFVICGKIGGQVLAAVDDQDRVLGFVNSFPGFRDGRVYLHSQMMGILPEYQNLGLGRQLKWAQREEALGRGIDLIEWTFDPLECRNARLNIEILGVICRRYETNVYGITSSPLHGGLPTDRLVAEWHLTSGRVRTRAKVGSAPPALAAADQTFAVEIPTDTAATKRVNPGMALKVLLGVRDQLRQHFGNGHCISGFSIDSSRQVASYKLQPFCPSVLNP